MELSKVIEQRRSVKQYEKHEIDKETLTNLLNQAALSPSAWNLQQWEVIVVHSDEAKEKLYQAANKQIKIKESSATFIILGNIHAHKNINLIADDWIEHQHIPAENREKLISNVNSFFEDETNKRDEAIRGASLFAMNLMLLSKDNGYSTCPMIGFNKSAVINSFNIQPHLVPVMLMTIGKGDTGNERASRFDASQFSKFE